MKLFLLMACSFLFKPKRFLLSPKMEKYCFVCVIKVLKLCVLNAQEFVCSEVGLLTSVAGVPLWSPLWKSD